MAYKNNLYPDDLPGGSQPSRAPTPASVAISEWLATQGPRPHEWRWSAIPALPNNWRAIVIDDSQCDLAGVERWATFYKAGAESLDGSQFVIFASSRIESLSEARLLALHGAIQLPPVGRPGTLDDGA